MALFDKSYDVLPDLLRGRILHTPHGEFTITAVEGYSKIENDSPLYRPVLSLKPGQAYFPRRRNAILFLIACRDGMAYGGCVLVRGLLSARGGALEGPGACSVAVGVTIPKLIAEVVERPDGHLQLVLPRQLATTSAAGAGTKGAPRERPPGVSREALERRMPMITDHYLAILASGAGAVGKFEEFLDTLLARCNTEGDLVRALKA